MFNVFPRSLVRRHVSGIGFAFGALRDDKEDCHVEFKSDPTVW
jgi:hypothetical protein